MIRQVIQLALLFLIILNPIGILPLCIAVLKPFPLKTQKYILLREMIFSLILMCLILFFGSAIFLGINVEICTLRVAGGIMLFVIGLRMVFAQPEEKPITYQDPFIVPLTIPAIVGPGIIATLCFYSGNPEYNQWIVVIALLIAWCITLPILLSFHVFSHVLKTNGLIAIERLFGFLLCVMAINMTIQGLLESLL